MRSLTALTEDAGVDPRVARTRDAVLQAVRELLREEGYAGITIEGVARRAGIARTTIYRHWSSSAQLVSDAFEASLAQRVPADTGDLRQDLIAELTQLAHRLRDEAWGGALCTLIDASGRDAELAELKAQTCDRRRQLLVEIVERGKARGELPAETDVQLLVDRLVGPLFYRHLVRRRVVTDAFVREVIATTLPPAMQRSATGRPPGGQARAASSVSLDGAK
jgi:AcrR family transcriptional regulator